jgi:hypothetical protein
MTDGHWKGTSKIPKRQPVELWPSIQNVLQRQVSREKKSNLFNA